MLGLGEQVELLDACVDCFGCYCVDPVLMAIVGYYCVDPVLMAMLDVCIECFGVIVLTLS